jgi:hypothetical protein
MEVPRPGVRLQCGSCGAQLVVVKSPADLPTCCGAPLTPAPAKASASA